MSFIDSIIANIDRDVTSQDHIADVDPARLGARIGEVAQQLRPYLVYIAILSQSGTDAPVARVLENTLDEGASWDYADVGRYGFNTTNGLLGQFYSWASVMDGDDAISAKRQQLRWASGGSRMVLAQHDGTSYVDGVERLYVEIRVFEQPVR